jgi:hypothetical protein
MICWLYQMRNGEKITVDRYVKDVWEGDILNWETYRVLSPRRSRPECGDMIILFFAERDNDKPGLYGLGKVIGTNEEANEIEFELKSPSDVMKNNPIWDGEVKDWVFRMKRNFHQATMWEITSDLLRKSNLPKTLPEKLRKIIAK